MCRRSASATSENRKPDTRGRRVSPAGEPPGGGTGSDLLAIAQKIVGIATEGSTSDGASSTNGDGKKIGVAIAAPDVEFVAYLSTGVSASSLIGQQKSIRYNATHHIFLIDSTNSTTALVTATLTGVPNGTEGDTNGPMYFKFLSSNVSEAVL